jgi:hypothetical protein
VCLPALMVGFAVMMLSREGAAALADEEEHD